LWSSDTAGALAHGSPLQVAASRCARLVRSIWGVARTSAIGNVRDRRGEGGGTARPVALSNRTRDRRPGGVASAPQFASRPCVARSPHPSHRASCHRAECPRQILPSAPRTSFVPRRRGAHLLRRRHTSSITDHRPGRVSHIPRPLVHISGLVVHMRAAIGGLRQDPCHRICGGQATHRGRVLLEGHRADRPRTQSPIGRRSRGDPTLTPPSFQVGRTTGLRSRDRLVLEAGVVVGSAWCSVPSDRVGRTAPISRFGRRVVYWPGFWGVLAAAWRSVRLSGGLAARSAALRWPLGWRRKKNAIRPV